MPLDHECFIGKSEIVIKSKLRHIFAYVGFVVFAWVYSLVLLGTQRVAVLISCLTVCVLLYISSRIKEESLLMIPNVGICMKQKTLLGRSTCQFYDATIIKDIVILEAVSLQQITTYLAVISLRKDGSQQIHPIFLKSKPTLAQLIKIYRQIQATFFHTVNSENR